MTLGFFLSTNTIDTWLESYGYLVVFLLVLIESIGVPVPGETALIGAALYAGSTHKLEIEWVILAAIAGAIIGDNIGFSIGRYGGARVLLRHGHRIGLDEGRLKIGIWLFRRHGGKVVFWGRFVSILRTYAAFLAGTNRMAWGRFLVFNAAGAVVWATFFGVVYYVFGSARAAAEHGDRHRRRRRRGRPRRRVHRLDEAEGGRAARARRARGRRLGRPGAR